MALSENMSQVIEGYQIVSNNDQRIIKIPSSDDCLLFNFTLDTVITGTLCLIGFIGNILSFIVFWKEKSHVSIMFLLEALVIADMTVVWMLFLQDVIPGLAYVMPSLQNCVNICNYISYVTQPLLWVAKACVLWFTVAAAFNRFIISCEPSNASLICTLEFARKQVVFIVMIAALVALPLTFDKSVTIEMRAFSSQHTTTMRLYDVKLYQYAYVNGVVLFLFLLLPLLVCTVVCAKLIKTMNSIKKLRRALANLYKTQNTEMSQVILTLSITLFVCYIPSCIKCMLHWSLSNFNEQCGFLDFYLDSFCKLFLALNSAMKVIIFSLFAKRFWETLKQIICHKVSDSSELEIFGMYKCADLSDVTIVSQFENHS